VISGVESNVIQGYIYSQQVNSGVGPDNDISLNLNDHEARKPQLPLWLFSVQSASFGITARSLEPNL
jgi:hypothetical protein